MHVFGEAVLVAGKAVKQALSGAKQLFDQRSQRAKELVQNGAVIVYSFLTCGRGVNRKVKNAGEQPTTSPHQRRNG